MSGLRWVVLVSLLVLAAAAGAVATTSRGEEHEGAGDPDRDAEAHVASRPGYEQRNAVKVFATAAAAGWAGEAKLAVEQCFELDRSVLAVAEQSDDLRIAQLRRTAPVQVHPRQVAPARR